MLLLWPCVSGLRLVLCGRLLHGCRLALLLLRLLLLLALARTGRPWLLLRVNRLRLASLRRLLLLLLLPPVEPVWMILGCLQLPSYRLIRLLLSIFRLLPLLLHRWRIFCGWLWQGKRKWKRMMRMINAIDLSLPTFVP